MSENKAMLTDGEIQRLAESQAEKEAFMKSTVVFVVIWALGFATLFVVPVWLRVMYFVVSFVVAFFAGLVTRWVVKSSAYEKYSALYREQRKSAVVDETRIE